jgi:hypothetical protein
MCATCRVHLILTDITIVREFILLCPRARHLYSVQSVYAPGLPVTAIKETVPMLLVHVTNYETLQFVIV